MRARFVVITLLLATALAGGRAQTRPNILLVTLDTTRADRMGFLGSTRGLTPALDALAADGIVFERAYAQAPITTVSHATVLSGTYPSSHGVADFGSPLAARVPYLPDILRRGGYRTGAFVGSLVLDPLSGTAPGFDRGFDRYDAGFRLRRPGESRYDTIERRGDDVAARAARWIAEGGSRPWFAWVHLYDPHDPYDPPADLKRRFAASPYDGEIAAVDRAAGRLLQAAGPSAIVAVTADHGESLGDHGEDTHGVFLYEAALHVPLVMRLPGRRAAGTRVTARVRLVDVAPTLLGAAAAPADAAMQGESLLPLSDRKAARAGGDRPAYAETDYPRHAFGWSALASWRNDRFLFIRAPKPELYDLVADPRATRNLADSRARVVDGMNAELERFIRGVSAAGDGRGPAPATTVAPEVAQRLAALGYVGGSGSAPAMTGVDPKDRIALANALHTAIVAVEDGAFAAAIPLLERVIREQPEIPIAQLNLGIARARQRQWAQAIPPLTRAAALQPDVPIARYELGVAFYETGDLQRAARAFEDVAKRMPAFADARYSLGSVYARIDRVADALTELRAAVALEPRHFRANLLLGRILTLQNQPTTAIPHLLTAASADPRSAEAQSFLADAYEKAGNASEAAKARQRARELSRP
jgi:arylsulfatase A-like enzyme/tetratricopeptide (TPR) repeat protein